MKNMAAPTSEVAFLFDVDNTLLDNDRVTADLQRHLETEVGSDRAQHYWSIFEQLRFELGYADYLGALQRYRNEYPRDPRLLTVSHFLINYPFADRLFPNALNVIERVRQWGTAVILSDGDVVFQPHKVDRSGLFDAVAGHVLIYVHKEMELEDVEQRYPAEHYVQVDDKLRLLTEPSHALHILNALRWLDAVGYHAWRALHHLSTDSEETADGSAIERDHEKFRND